MATLSSHLLNSVNGTHASNVDIIIYQIKSNGEKKVFYESKTDAGGRLLKDLILMMKIVNLTMKWFVKLAIIFQKKK